MLHKLGEISKDPFGVKFIIRQYNNGNENGAMITRLMQINKDYKAHHGSHIIDRDLGDHYHLKGQKTQRENVLDYSEFKDLEKEMVSITNEFFKINDTLIAPLKFRLNSWANILDKGSYHVAHSHPGTSLVINYYLRTAPDSKIIFLSPDNMGVFDISRNIHQHSMQVYDGLMIASPPWILHEVPPPTTDILRISLSTNVIEL